MTTIETINEYPDALCWQALESVVGKKRCKEFMFMATVRLQDGECLYLYKHYMTRCYLNLNNRCQFYRYTPGPLNGKIQDDHYSVSTAEEITAALQTIFPDVNCDSCSGCKTTMPICCLNQCSLCGRYHCEACCIQEGLCCCQINVLKGAS